MVEPIEIRRLLHVNGNIDSVIYYCDYYFLVYTSRFVHESKTESAAEKGSEQSSAYERSNVIMEPIKH